MCFGTLRCGSSHLGEQPHQPIPEPDNPTPHPVRQSERQKLHLQSNQSKISHKKVAAAKLPTHLEADTTSDTRNNPPIRRRTSQYRVSYDFQLDCESFEKCLSEAAREAVVAVALVVAAVAVVDSSSVIWVLLRRFSRWASSCTPARVRWSANPSTPKSPTSTPRSSSRTKPPSARSTRSSAPSTRSTSPSSPPRASRPPPSRRATSSTLAPRSSCPSRSSSPSPSPRRAPPR